MSETVTSTAPAGETTATPVIPASVVVPAAAATETAPAVTPAETPAGPVSSPADASATTEPSAAGAAPETPAADAPEETPATEQPAAPVYADFTFPEGVKADADLVGKAKEVFGKYGLTQEAAQELVDFHSNAAQKTLEAYQAQATDYWAGKSKEWVAEVQSDPQIGGNRLNTSLELARAALNEGLPAADRDRLWADLTDTKIGDHPVLIKRMVQLGRERQQVLQLTGTTTWADAIKKLREPPSPPANQPAKPNGSGRPADRRYQPRTN